jgi:hypothetical protein
VLYGTGGSIKAVLKSANIADVDAMLAQTTASQRDVVATLTGSYTFRCVGVDMAEGHSNNDHYHGFCNGGVGT